MIPRTNPFPVVLDSCVLVPMPLVDTLLRLAEQPALFLPHWSADILNELARTLTVRFGLTQAQANNRLSRMTAAFPEAKVEGYQALVQTLSLPDPNDRHVFAAALTCGARIIVTANTRHFPADALRPRGIAAMHPDDFLLNHLNRNEPLVIERLSRQSAAVGMTVAKVLALLHASVPKSARRIGRTLGLSK